jgi:hypothetical protein
MAHSKRIWSSHYLFTCHGHRPEEWGRIEMDSSLFSLCWFVCLERVCGLKKGNLNNSNFFLRKFTLVQISLFGYKIEHLLSRTVYPTDNRPEMWNRVKLNLSNLFI